MENMKTCGQYRVIRDSLHEICMQLHNNNLAHLTCLVFPSKLVFIRFQLKHDEYWNKLISILM